MTQLDQTFGELHLGSLVRQLDAQVSAVHANELGRSEEMLIAQAHTLDLLFNRLILRSTANGDQGNLDAAETYMRLALRAQSQARATLETLSVIKNPPTVAFVRQANIANGPQQVNNGTAASPKLVPRAREIPQSQLMEQHGNEWLDTRASQAPRSSDPSLAPVGALNGSANTRG